MEGGKTAVSANLDVFPVAAVSFVMAQAAMLSKSKHPGLPAIS